MTAIITLVWRVEHWSRIYSEHLKQQLSPWHWSQSLSMRHKCPAHPILSPVSLWPDLVPDGRSWLPSCSKHPALKSSLVTDRVVSPRQCLQSPALTSDCKLWCWLQPSGRTVWVPACLAPLLLGSVDTRFQEAGVDDLFLRSLVPFTWDLVSTASPFCTWKSSPRSLCAEANHGL